VGKASSVKGAKAERDLAAILTQLLNTPVRRMLGAGRSDDIGDLDGVHDWTLQVANRANLGDTIRNKPLEVERQRANAGTPFCASIVKLPPQPGGKPQEWRVVLTLEQFAVIVDALR
jgi:hypothetical protein